MYILRYIYVFTSRTHVPGSRPAHPTSTLPAAQTLHPWHRRSVLLAHATISTCPVSHSSVHGVQVWEPEMAANFPASHGVHAEEALSLYLPGVHILQSAPLTASYPGTHRQAARDLDPTGDSILAGQFWQVPALPVPQPETY